MRRSRGGRLELFTDVLDRLARFFHAAINCRAELLRGTDIAAAVAESAAIPKDIYCDKQDKKEEELSHGFIVTPNGVCDV